MKYSKYQDTPQRGHSPSLFPVTFLSAFHSPAARPSSRALRSTATSWLLPDSLAVPLSLGGSL